MSSSDAGKGDTYRPTDMEKFRENYERALGTRDDTKRTDSKEKETKEK